VKHPVIKAGKPETYNRRYRRALVRIGRELDNKRRFDLLSNLIGEPKGRAAKHVHFALVAEFHQVAA
jgi:hypothetical protein